LFHSHNSRILLVTVVIVASIGIVTALFVTGIIPLGPSCIGVNGSNRTFTIIANSTGFNNSKTVAPNSGYGIWPIANASRCDNITFKVMNTDSSAHGFAIALYQQAVTVAPGQTVSFSFVAVKTGQFRIYCTVLCLPHDYMQNGQLNIT
jgi:nitrous oxide reductase